MNPDKEFNDALERAHEVFRQDVMEYAAKMYADAIDELAVPPLSDADKAVREYHRLTELFDRALPHVMTEDGARPLSGEPMAKSNSYAASVRQAQLDARTFTREEWFKANARYVVSREFASDMAALTR